ncbi:MAG TPA: DUF2252 domain-containing protein [Thermoplasmata archaeon]|nr:DUF2252 domain-containing protein [Thermoplasmata archaeon]
MARDTGKPPRRARPFRSRAARYRAGKALRHKVPRSSHAHWRPSKDRPDVVELLQVADRDRVTSLLPVRYGRMASSAFGFLRGSAGVMAHDLTSTPSTGLPVQMAGDAHVGNFGIFATPERDEVFDVNDFDETLVGPWEWDLKRLVTSLVLVGRMNGFPGRICRVAVRSAIRAYRDRMEAYARMRYIDIWYAHLDLAEVSLEVRKEGRRLFAREVAEARDRTGFRAFPRMTSLVRGQSRIREAPPLIVHYSTALAERNVREVFERYSAELPPERRDLLDRYVLQDVAQKVVGIGSVGTRCAVGLFLSDRDLLDPLFLQIKEAGSSVFEKYLGPAPYPNHAERVVVGQRSIQEASDIFLGFSSAGGRDYYVRQLRDMKLASDLLALGPRSLFGQAQLCGASLARSHARTGDPAEIAGYLGSGEAFGTALTAFAEAYARQSESDHQTLVTALKRGLLPGDPGP